MEENFTEQYGGGAEGGKMNFWRTPASYGQEQTSQWYGDKERSLRLSTLHAVKMLCRVLMIVSIIYIVVYVVSNVNYVIATAVNLSRGKYGASGLSAVATQVSSFSNAEGFQYLGASTNILRGDNDREADSLAEKAMRSATQVTDMSKFTSRERLTTPEEELMKKMKK